MFNYEQLLQLNYPVYSSTFWRIFCSVWLFHHVRLLILEESSPLCNYFILFIYLILKSIWEKTKSNLAGNLSLGLSYHITTVISVHINLFLLPQTAQLGNIAKIRLRLAMFVILSTFFKRQAFLKSSRNLEPLSNFKTKTKNWFTLIDFCFLRELVEQWNFAEHICSVCLFDYFEQFQNLLV